jgi:DNA-directed RNA polymerase specialized sigma24 family protein
MADLDDHLPGIVAREEEAFVAWLAGAEPALRRALRRFATTVDVEAVLQETLLRVWQVAPQHKPDGQENSLLRLAHRIGRNLAVDEARRVGVRGLDGGAHDDGFLEPIDPAPPPDPLLQRAVRACLQALRGAPRRALQARLQAAGQKDDALAAELTMRVNTFRQNVKRAREALRTCLEDRGIDLKKLLGR